MNNVNTLPTLYQQFIHQTRYAKWIENKNRREIWEETVDRYMTHMIDHLENNHGVPNTLLIYRKIKDYILNLKTMPSMRALMTSGLALEKDNIAGFNCSYMPMNHPRCFDEMVYILMCGSGVGFSVERQEVNQLPTVPENLVKDNVVIFVEDSKLGWAQAVRKLVELLYNGSIPELDTSAVRAAGERLKTFGGRASGPKPLRDLYEFLIQTFKKAKGRKLTSTEVHDICCKIGDVVVSGGVRRSALLSLSNLSDERMRDAKSGEWWINTPWRRLSNNSVAYTEKPDVGRWMKEWSSIYDSKSGERGIFNRAAVIKQCEDIGRATYHNDFPISFGSNPCVEIVLRPFQFCNLTEIVAREDDTIATLKDKITVAVFLGTYQSTLTDYKYIRDIWKQNSEDERLLGVSLTGIMDCPLINGRKTNREERNAILRELRDYAIFQNRIFAKLFGINESAAITCVKPSGTVSQLTNSASGIHTRYSQYYIRTPRNAVKDPITDFLIKQGVQCEPDIMDPDNTVVFSFPIRSAEGCITRKNMTAIEQLENWLDFRDNWCQHNPSVTINVKEHEWPEVGAWVYNHFDKVAGISFLPDSDHIYKQAPYQEVGLKEIEDLELITPKAINWLLNVEDEDLTVGTQTLACSSGSCEI